MRTPQTICSFYGLAELCSLKNLAIPGTLWTDILFSSQGAGKAVSFFSMLNMFLGKKVNRLLFYHFTDELMESEK